MCSESRVRKKEVCILCCHGYALSAGLGRVFKPGISTRPPLSVSRQLPVSFFGGVQGAGESPDTPLPPGGGASVYISAASKGAQWPASFTQTQQHSCSPVIDEAPSQHLEYGKSGATGMDIAVPPADPPPPS